MYEGRRTPLRQLVRRLGLETFDTHPDYQENSLAVSRVTLPLQQHTGVPAQRIVEEGVSVRAGECVADIPAGSVGSRIHASIQGGVAQANGSIVIERR